MAQHARIDAVRISVASPDQIRRQPEHVELAVPVIHPWFCFDDASALPLLLDLPAARIRQIVAERQPWITHVDEVQRERAVASIWENLHQRRADDERRRADRRQSLAAEDLAMIADMEADHGDLVAAVYVATTIGDWIAEVERRLSPSTTDERFDRLIRELHEQRAWLGRTRPPETAEMREIARRMTRRLHTRPLDDWYRERLAEPRRRVQAIEASLREASPFHTDNGSEQAGDRERTLRRLEIGPAPDQATLREIDRLIGSAPRFFTVLAGSAAIYDLMRRLDLDALAARLEEEEYACLAAGDARPVPRIRRRRRVVEQLRRSEQRPEWLMLTVLPVLTADDRPTERDEVDDEDDVAARRFAPNLHAQYGRLIEANQRLRALLPIGGEEAEEIDEAMLRETERTLQRAVQSIIGALGDRVAGRARGLGRARLTESIDFAGRAVAVPDPALGLDQCGLPIPLALELLGLHVARWLVAHGDAADLAEASRLIRQGGSAVVDALDEIVTDHLVLLSSRRANGQPVVRAFEVTLTHGSADQIVRVHPLAAALLEVCRLEGPGYGAPGDDGEAAWVAVRAVLSQAARREARARLLPSQTILGLANGTPEITPSGDVVLGCYYLTTERPGARGQDRRFGCWADAIRAYELGTVQPDAALEVQARIQVQMRYDYQGVGGLREYDPQRDRIDRDAWSSVTPEQLEMVPTTVGRIILFTAINEALADRAAAPVPFENKRLDVGGLRALVERIFRQDGRQAAAAVLETLTRLGGQFATRSGISLGMDDVAVTPAKQRLLADVDADIAYAWKRYDHGLIDAVERHEDALVVWTRAKDAITNAVDRALDPFGPITMMAQSGGRGNVQVVSQIMGMRGLVALASGEIPEVPIRSSFSEGLSSIEYFMSTLTGRRNWSVGWSRQARAADLLRRLAVVAEDVVVTEEDCGVRCGTWLDDLADPYRGDAHDRLLGRYLAEDAWDETAGEVVIGARTLIEDSQRDRLRERKVARVSVRSPLTCEARHGVCQRCYGWDRAQCAPVAIGAMVGSAAVQAIAGRADELAHRYFAYGIQRAEWYARWEEQVRRGAIRAGIEGVDALFEHRAPMDAAILSEIPGVVEVQARADGRWISVTDPRVDGDSREMRVPPDARLTQEAGAHVAAGDLLTDGECNVDDVLRILGVAAAERYLVKELDGIYRGQGSFVDEKHFEVIVRQMRRFERILDPGDAPYLPGALIDRFDLEETNQRLARDGSEPATAEPVVVGISEAAANLNGFLAAACASGDPRGVFGRAALAGALDRLTGLHAQAIVGNPIPG